MTGSFHTQFSAEARRTEREKWAAARIAHLEAEIAAPTHKLAQAEAGKQEFMRRYLSVEFEARVAKGCYTLCPRGRLTP